ncbi:MAG: hypothetical protein WC799_18235 [Desulfobacteraceae bacterium]|jgi:hypothetical protein
METTKNKNSVNSHTGHQTRHGHTYLWYRMSAALSPWRRHLRSNSPWRSLGATDKVCSNLNPSHDMTPDRPTDILSPWDEILPLTHPM